MIGSVLMVVALAVSTGGSAQALKNFQAKTLNISVPVSWTHTNEEGTEKFKAPTGEAFFTLDVGAVQTAGMKPQMCLDKILTAMGGAQGWKSLKLGKAPAARRVDADTTPDRSASVETVTYVGCDGKTTWSLVFHMDMKQKDRFEALATEVANTVAYSKPIVSKKGK